MKKEGPFHKLGENEKRDLIQRGIAYINNNMDLVYERFREKEKLRIFKEKCTEIISRKCEIQRDFFSMDFLASVLGKFSVSVILHRKFSVCPDNPKSYTTDISSERQTLFR